MKINGLSEMKMKIKCENCAYYGYNEQYDREICNFWDETRTAPCEEGYDDEELENDFDE